MALRTDMGRGLPREDKTMSTTANRTRGAVPTRMAAAVAVVSLLAMPMPAGAQGSSRTVLLTLTDGVNLSQLADTVGALGGRVLSTLELSDSLLVELPKGIGAPAGSAEIPDTPMKVNGTRTIDDDSTCPPTSRLSRPRDVGCSARVSLSRWLTRASRQTCRRPAGTSTHINVSGDVGGRRPRTRDLPCRHHRRATAPTREWPQAPPLVDVQVADAEGNTSLSKVLAGPGRGCRSPRRRCREHQSLHRQPPSPLVRSSGPGPGAAVGQGRDRRRGGRQRRARRRGQLPR